MSDELKPCPFCGGEPEFWSGGCAQYYGHEHQDVSIDCHSCSLSVRVETGQDKDGNTNKGFDLPCSCCHDITCLVVKKWNTRAQPSDGALTNEGAEPVLSKPAKVGSVRFGKGIKERLVIEAAQRHFEYAMQPEVEEARLDRLRATITAVHAPATASVVLPDERTRRTSDLRDEAYDNGWNACLDRVKELNK